MVIENAGVRPVRFKTRARGRDAAPRLAGNDEAAHTRAGGEADIFRVGKLPKTQGKSGRAAEDGHFVIKHGIEARKAGHAAVRHAHASHARSRFKRRPEAEKRAERKSKKN